MLLSFQVHNIRIQHLFIRFMFGKDQMLFISIKFNLANFFLLKIVLRILSLRLLSIAQVNYDTKKPSLHHPSLSYKPLSVLPKSRQEGSPCELRWEAVVGGYSF